MWVGKICIAALSFCFIITFKRLAVVVVVSAFPSVFRAVDKAVIADASCINES